ncbi:MAG: NTP transferase domain-containing protein [Syntrophomonadaceae bacterium]|nr:NTP transferase domain-containing protein [Syntrophomonadaceae bacterium]
MKKYDAVILAGGINSGELRKFAPFENEALIIIGSSPMICYIQKALKKTSCVGNIIISCPGDSVRQIFSEDDKLIFVNSGEDAMESFANAVPFIKSDKVLVLPADIPFITQEAIEDFVNRCEEYEADVYYPLVSREVNEARFPGVRRTYVRLKQGVFTGGNLFLVKTEAVIKALDMGKKLVANRKHPLAIVRLFGADLVFKYITGQLSIPDIEKRFEDVLGIKGKAIISQYAEVGVDVDKPSDLKLAEKVLGQGI